MSQYTNGALTREAPPIWARGRSGGYAFTLAAFAMPAVDALVTITVDDTSWMQEGQYLFIGNEVASVFTGGLFRVVDKLTGAFSAELIEYDENAEIGTVLPISSLIVISGPPNQPGVSEVVANATYAKLATVMHYLSLDGATGGTATKLDSLVTTGAGAYATGAVVEYYDSAAGVTLRYRLVAGTTAEAAPWTIRADDYASGTNEKVWTLIDVRKPGAIVIWNANTSKFHYATAYGAAASVGIDLDQTGFSLT